MEMPEILSFRIRTPIWIYCSLEMDETPLPVLVKHDIECEIKIPKIIRKRMNYRETIKYIDRIRKYAEYELEVFLDEKSRESKNDLD